MTLISALFLIFIFSINTIEATGPKDLNPEKTKADANLSQSSAVSGAKEKIDLKNGAKNKIDLKSGAKEKIDLKNGPAETKKDLEILKQIILEDASSSVDLAEAEIQAIKLELAISESDFIPQGLKIIVEDDQLKATGALKDFIENPNKIKALLNEAEFIEKIMEAIKAEHKLTGEYSYSLKMGDADTGSFEIYFYKSPEDLNKDLVKEIILEDASSSRDLDAFDKKNIQDQFLFKDILISKGFKIIVQDDQFSYGQKLYNFITNLSKIKAILNEVEFIEKIMKAIKEEHKLTGEYSYSLNMGDVYRSGIFYIYFYKNAAKSLKSRIIKDLANCRDLEETEVQALKTPEAKAEGIYDGKYISNACEILIEDRNLVNLIYKNKVDNLKEDTNYKQELADRLNNPNLNLDKHMSIYIKFDDRGRLRVILAETRNAKEQALKQRLTSLTGNNKTESKEKAIEELYGVKYINLGMYYLYYREDEDADWFQSGQEFEKSFTLINEILNTDQEVRTFWINKTNEHRRGLKIQEIPNDSNTILRSRLIDQPLAIGIFTLSDSPEPAIQANILDEIDKNIIIYRKKYESIRSSDAIKGFEVGRSLKQGLKFNQIEETRFNKGSLSSYYNNSEAMNKLLDDADFKRKVITKINDYQENNQKFKETIDFVFSTDNLENIKIQAQDFSGDYFELVVYELYPPGESAPTNPSAGESAEPAVDGESEVSGESPTDGASPVDGD